MLKDMAEMLFGEKKCARCDSRENIRRVAVSSFSGRREYKWLCQIGRASCRERV